MLRGRHVVDSLQPNRLETRSILPMKPQNLSHKRALDVKGSHIARARALKRCFSRDVTSLAVIFYVKLTETI